MSHERVNRDIEPAEGGAALRYRHAGPAWTDPPSRAIDEMRLEEILSLTDFSEDERAAFSQPKRIAVMCNGWQSWSPSWEAGPGERMPGTRGLKRFGVFIRRPGDRERRGRLRSHFFIYFRSGGLMAGLVSRNAGTAPVGFEFSRKSGAVRIDLQSAGKRRANGETLADVRVVWGRDYFSFKDRLGDVFSGFRSFDRLSFLRARGAERPVPGGWESWYNHYSDIDEDLILDALKSLDDNGNFVNRYYIERGKPTVFQVDDGWEIAVGDWEANRERFPNGMKRIADRVRGKGFLPGIWIAPFVVTTISRVYHERPEWLLRDARGKPVRAGWLPAWGGYFHCLDISSEAVRAHLDALFHKLVEEWGFRYLKLDFLYAGLLEGKRAGGGAAYEWYEDVMGRAASATRNAEGKPVAWLGCGAPLEPSFRHFPLMRVGADTREAWDIPAARCIHYPGRPSAWMSLRDVIGRALLDGTVFASDPDVIFLRSTRCKLTRTERELLALVDFMFGSQLMVSDDVQCYPRGDEEALTSRVVELYDRLSGREWGAQRVEGQVFRVFSRSGDVTGIVNLGNGPYKAAESEGMKADRAIVRRFSLDRGCLLFERHSISLFESS
jgi:alpha-galactosidase